MRPTFMGFETAKRGLMINQKGLDIVGHNIGNLGVTGYTRQRVDQVSISTQGMTGRYGTKSALLAGQGANINGVAQLRDPYLDKRFRQENADVGYYDKLTKILTDAESAMNELGNANLASSIERFQAAIATLTAGTGVTPTNANVLRTAAKSMTQVMQQMDIKLNNIIDQQQFDLEVNVEDVNLLLSRVAELNKSISRECSSSDRTNGYYPPNELMDERNVLLDELSKYGNLQIKTNRDNTVDVTMGNHPVVMGDKHETMNYVKNTDNTVLVTWQTNGKEVNFPTGSIRASVDMINGAGPGATGNNNNYERGIPYYKEQIDSFARGIATTFNKVIPEVDTDGKIEVDASGNTVFKELFSFDATKDKGAASINVSDAWNADSNYVLTPTSTAGAYDNTYFLQMKELIDTASIGFDVGYKGTFNDYVKTFATTLGDDLGLSESRLSASGTIADSVLDSISQISGVSMDEEGADMMAYNKAYAAMSRILTSLDEALDVLINRTGTVGR